MGCPVSVRGIYTFSRFFCISVLALGAGLSGASGETGQACPDEAFHVRGVEVSASAGNGSEARAIATLQGLDQAWKRLTGRLLLDGEEIDDDGVLIDDMVDHVRVLNETVLPKRYIAAFDYCFDRAKTRRHFADLGVRHAELVSAPMLVLPIWNSAGKPRIWRRPNLWADAWQEVLEGRTGLVTLRLPQSLAIERAVSPEAAFNRRSEILALAAQIEGVEKVVVTLATPTVAGDERTVSVSAYLHARDGSMESEFYRLDTHAFPADSAEESLRWLAGQIEHGIEKVWRDVNAVNLEEASNTVSVRISADTIAEWRNMVDRLRSLAPVERVGVLQLDSGGGLVRVELSSSMQSLIYALEAEGLAIDERVGGDGSVVLALVPRRS